MRQGVETLLPAVVVPRHKAQRQKVQAQPNQAQEDQVQADQHQAHLTWMLWQIRWPQYWDFRKAAAATLLPL